MKCLFLILTLWSFKGYAQTEEAAIKQTINNLFDAMRKGDSTLLRSSFTPGAILQSVSHNKQGETVVITEPLDTFITVVFRPHKEVYDERIIFDIIKIDGELAMAWTPYKFYLGDKFSHCGVDSYQLVKINGMWKIQYLIDTRRRTDCL